MRTAAPGSYVDGNGLMLRVKARGTRQWVQRLTIHGRRVAAFTEKISVIRKLNDYPAPFGL